MIVLLHQFPNKKVTFELNSTPHNSNPTPSAVALLLSVPPDAYTIHGHAYVGGWLLEYRRSPWWQGNTIESRGEIVRTPSFPRYCEVLMGLLKGRQYQREFSTNPQNLPQKGT